MDAEADTVEVDAHLLDLFVCEHNNNVIMIEGLNNQFRHNSPH